MIAQRVLQDITSAEEQNEIIEKIHNRAHRGISENLQVLKNDFFFPNMKSKLRKFISLCSNCKKAKYDRKPYNIKLTEVPQVIKPMDVIHIDLFFANSETFLSAVDAFSRYGILTHIKTKNINDVRKGLLKVLETFPQPKLIVADNEPAIKSIEIRGLLESMNIRTYFTPVNRSEVNGICEKFHNTIAELYRCIKPRHPELSTKQLFQVVVSLYNSTIHSAHKRKPASILYALEEDKIRSLDPEEMIKARNALFDEVLLELQKYKNKTISAHNKNREIEPKFEKNEIVFVARQGVKNKTQPKFLPVKVKEDRQKTFIDEDDRKIHKNNVKRLTPN